MIKAISISNNARKSIMGLMLLGSAGVCSAAAANATVPDTSRQTSTLISKAGADALAANALKITMPDSLVVTPEGDMLLYDESGRLVKEYYLTEKRTIDCYYTYEYDSFGRPETDIKYSADNKIEWIKKYYYNADNTSTEVTVFEDGTCRISNYDKDDYLLNSTIYDKENHVDLRYEYTTDENGNRIETIYDRDGNIISE